MSNVAQAVQLFQEGCACSQAILSVYGELLGLDRNTALRIASGFGGGMRLGSICGAVTGAIMVLGLRHGSQNCSTLSGRAEVNLQVVEFEKQFTAVNGSLVCRDLLGCDISTPQGMEQAKKQGLFKTTCVKMVEDAARILEEMR
jgi:C_GCAxxG_C_C family probable redox protein